MTNKTYSGTRSVSACCGDDAEEESDGDDLHLFFFSSQVFRS